MVGQRTAPEGIASTPSASGCIPGTPPPMEQREKRRVTRDPQKRAAACDQFALNLTLYRSLDLFLTTRPPLE